MHLYVNASMASFIRRNELYSTYQRYLGLAKRKKKLRPLWIATVFSPQPTIFLSSLPCFCSLAFAGMDGCITGGGGKLSAQV